MIERAFDGNQGIKINPVHRRLSVRTPDSALPGLGKICPGEISEEINAVWRDTNLENLIGILRIEQSRASKATQSLVRSGNI